MNILGYLNKLIYTDIDAYKVFEENGKTYAVKVEKKIDNSKVEAVNGGFCRVVLNNSELYADPTCEIVEIGKPFEITRKNGVWGYKDFVSRNYLHGCCSIREGCNDLELEQGEEFDTIYELTKTGKRKTTFVKLGNIENECHYFKDMNF